VIAPRDCPCQGYGLVKPKSQKLASVYVQARSSSGRVLATAPAKKLFIEGNGTEGLQVGFTYAFQTAPSHFPRAAGSISTVSSLAADRPATSFAFK
jgi:hypothetical protein